MRGDLQATDAAAPPPSLSNKQQPLLPLYASLHRAARRPAHAQVLARVQRDSRRSTGYKIFALINGAPVPIEFGLFEDSQAVITLPPGAVAQITVAAHNNPGYSAESAPVNATAP